MIYRFADFEIYEQIREIRHRGRALRCQPKVLDLITLLLHNRHHVVPKETLFREIWPGVAVSDCSISRLVKEARRRLADDFESEARIRTVHGRGYCFAGDVECENEPGERGEADALIVMAQRSLEVAFDDQRSDFKVRLREFVSACHLAIDEARSEQA